MSEDEAAAIRTAFEQEGELSAGIELRRLFPGIADGAKAREMARVIAGWKPLPAGQRPSRQSVTPTATSMRARRVLQNYDGAA